MPSLAGRKNAVIKMFLYIHGEPPRAGLPAPNPGSGPAAKLAGSRLAVALHWAEDSTRVLGQGRQALTVESVPGLCGQLCIPVTA